MLGHHHPCRDLHDRDHPHHLDPHHLDHDQMELGADLPPMLGRLCSCLAPRPSWKIPSPLCPGYHHCHRNHDHNHHYCNSHNQDYNFLLEDPFSSSVIIIMLIIIIIMGRITIVRDLIFQVLKCSLLETAFLLLATVIIIIIVIIVFVVIIIVIIVIVKENRRKKYH